VGPRFDGRVDETVDATDRVLTPGLISTHAHVSGSPLDRSFIEDCGNPQFWFSGLFEMLPVRSDSQDEEAGRACVDFSMAELLRGGVTTVMEIGTLGDYVVERAPHYGLRVYMGQAFRSGKWLTRDGKRVEWEWNEEQGRQGLKRAVEFHKRWDGAHGDLVLGCRGQNQDHVDIRVVDQFVERASHVGDAELLGCLAGGFTALAVHRCDLVLRQQGQDRNVSVVRPVAEADESEADPRGAGLGCPV